MSTEEVTVETDTEENAIDFKVPPPKPISEIMEADKGDESLTNYKLALMGNPEKCAGELKLEIIKLTVETKDNRVLEYPLGVTISPADKGRTIKVEDERELPEGSEFNSYMHFKVLSGMVYALQCHQTVQRMGMKVLSQKLMVGTYRADDDVVNKAKLGDECSISSGMTFRGNYTVSFKLEDSDHTIDLRMTTKIKVVKASKKEKA